jgi:hypothetical protein
MAFLFAFLHVELIRFYRFLDLSDNSISGTIPSSFLESSNITNRVIEVVLDNNNIEGLIPSSLAKFSRLDIRLSDNRIEGIATDLCENNNW